MEGMQPERIADLKAVLKKLKEQRRAILTGNPPCCLISKDELIERIRGVIGSDSPFKKVDNDRWGRFVELFAANLVTSDNVATLAEQYHLNLNMVFQTRKVIMSKIVAVVPELEQILKDLYAKKYSPGWSRKRKFAEKEAAALTKKRQRAPEVYCTETLPANPLDMDEEEIAQWFCPQKELEGITVEMVEESFLAHIDYPELQLPFTQDQIKSFIHTIAMALVNPDEDVNLSQNLFMFLTKIGRSGKKDIDQIAVTIRKLLSSGR